MKEVVYEVEGAAREVTERELARAARNLERGVSEAHDFEGHIEAELAVRFGGVMLDPKPAIAEALVSIVMKADEGGEEGGVETPVGAWAWPTGAPLGPIDMTRWLKHAPDFADYPVRARLPDEEIEIRKSRKVLDPVMVDGQQVYNQFAQRFEEDGETPVMEEIVEKRTVERYEGDPQPPVMRRPTTFAECLYPIRAGQAPRLEVAPPEPPPPEPGPE